MNIPILNTCQRMKITKLKNNLFLQALLKQIEVVEKLDKGSIYESFQIKNPLTIDLQVVLIRKNSQLRNFYYYNFSKSLFFYNTKKDCSVKY